MPAGSIEARICSERHGLDLERLAAVLDAGPLASDVSRVEAAKPIEQRTAKGV